MTYRYWYIEEGQPIEFGSCKTDSVWMGFEVMSLKEAFKKVSQKVLAQGRIVVKVRPERF